MSRRYPCPCCGHLVLDEMPGSYAICPVCFWEDDAIQFRWPTMDGGANKVSLIEAQRNYQDFGACDQHGRGFVRPPAANEPLDPAWRPINLARDSFEVWGTEDWAPWPSDPSVLCWWLPTFWRRDQPASWPTKVSAQPRPRAQVASSKPTVSHTPPPPTSPCSPPCLYDPAHDQADLGPGGRPHGRVDR